MSMPVAFIDAGYLISLSKLGENGGRILAELSAVS